jgi:hypothetical protein
VIIDGVFDAATTGGIIFTAATGLDANAVADVQACVRRRLLAGAGRMPDDPFRQRTTPSSPLTRRKAAARR